MQLTKSKQNNVIIQIKSITWLKDSHSLFDYQSNRINNNTFNFPINTKNIAMYRRRQSSQVIAIESNQIANIDRDEYQFLTKFQIQPIGTFRYKFTFIDDIDKTIKKVNSQRLNTDGSNSISLREQQTYLIVRKQKDINGQPKGYKLQAGQTIKLGRVEFFVSQICINQKKTSAKMSKQKIKINKPSMKFHQKQQKQDDDTRCKICLEQTSTKDNFLFNPCKCSGSCGTVHIECLTQWIGIKVKKQIFGGTLHYNFQKFQCQVCKTQLPLIIETQDDKIIEMLPIEKPKGNYMVLQGACQKTKSVMMIKNVPESGIKLGRGHDCQIRITDISVSRTHALVKYFANGFYIFDNKSKFGTLVKEENMSVEVGVKFQQGVQIGRTVVVLDVVKDVEIRKEVEIKKEVEYYGNSKKGIQRK